MDVWWEALTVTVRGINQTHPSSLALSRSLCSYFSSQRRFSLRTTSPEQRTHLISAPPGATWARVRAPAVPTGTSRTDVTAAWCVHRRRETPAAARRTCPAGTVWSAGCSPRGGGEAPGASAGVRQSMKCVAVTGKRTVMCVKWEQPAVKPSRRGNQQLARRTKDRVHLRAQVGQLGYSEGKSLEGGGK